MTPADRVGLLLNAAAGGLTTTQIADITGLDYNQVAAALTELLRADKTRLDDRADGTVWVK